jgi:uncharacterized protein (DUF302 family)
MIMKIEVERLTVISSKPIEQVVAGIKAAVGKPNTAEFWKSTHAAETFAELEVTIEKVLGQTGLMLFAEFDHGAVVRKGTGRDTPKNFRLIIGNPLIMRLMVQHVPDAGSYAPVTILVDERPDGTHVSYDRMTSFLEAYGNEDALRVARDLDAKVEELLASATN